jgi:hypothetical protein
MVVSLSNSPAATFIFTMLVIFLCAFAFLFAAYRLDSITPTRQARGASRGSVMCIRF